MATVKLGKGTLSALAGAARKKTGRSARLTPRGIADEVGMIPSCGKNERDAEWILRTLRTASFPEGITAIRSNAFRGCKSLALDTLPPGIAAIEEDAFSGCEGMMLESLPESVASVAARAFDGCKALAITEIPAGVTKIDVFAFRSCSGLRSLTFSGKPETVSGNAFYLCTNLTVINVPWAEGEVAGAPWGAAWATINYDFKEANDGKGDAL